MIKTQTVDTDSDWLIVRVQSSEFKVQSSKFRVNKKLWRNSQFFYYICA